MKTNQIFQMLAFTLIFISSFSSISQGEVSCCDTVYTYYEDGESIQYKISINSLGVQDGYFYKYYQSGGLEMRMSYKNGEIDGFSEKWNEDGVKVREVQYVEGLKHGDYKVFNDDGSLKTHWIFDLGKYVETKYGESPN